MAVFVCDFDGTLVATNPMADDPTPGDWLPGALDMLRSLIDAGHTWIISSVRNNPQPFPGAKSENRDLWFGAMVEKIRADLAEHVDAGKIRIDDGRSGKPFGIHYLDERAIAIGAGPAQRGLGWVRASYGAW